MEIENNTAKGPESERREFLSKCGKFALVTPPVVTMLLSTSMSRNAMAAHSGFPGKGNHRGFDRQGNNGFGNGGGDGVPGNSDFGDANR